MKIAFVQLDAQVTGGQVVAHQLMRAARAAGHDVLAVFPEDGPMQTLLATDGIEARVLPLDRAFRLDQALRLARILRREGIDVIDTHTLFVGNQLARIAGRLARIPVVAHVHIAERYSGRRGVARAQRALDRLTARFVETFVAVSQQLGEDLLAKGVEPARVRVVHNGVAVAPAIAARAQTPMQVVCAARIAPVKGQDVLLRAVALLDGGVEVTCVGRDLERDSAFGVELERLAQQVPVRFLGYRDDLAELFAAADVCVLPSYDEGLPLVVLEAMERSCAVVATAVGGTPEAVVDRETGLLVPPGDVERLADALRRLRDDPGLRRRLGDAGRARVAHRFSSEDSTRRTLEILDAAARARAR
jgi:glycosyltransferase involved in cell wall biosynthesis